MSDKSYTPASGETFSVRRHLAGNWLIQKGNEKASEHPACFTLTRIDSTAQRILSQKQQDRKLFWVYAKGNKRVLSWPGGSIELDAMDLTEGTSSSSGKLKPLKVTMPGKVVAVKVKEGDLVQADQGLVVVEAMKMENIIKAPADGVVKKVAVQKGDKVEKNQVMISMG